MRTPGGASGRDVKKLRGFDGLDNVHDPMRGIPASPGVAPRTWQLLQQADNIDISDAGAARRRQGYTHFVAGDNITASYTTFDFSRLYVIDAGTLKRIHHDGSVVPLATGLTGEAYWAEVNDVVYLSCGQKLEIHPNNTVKSWGIPTPVGGNAVNASGSMSPGMYQVCFTFIDPDGRESGAGASIPVMVADGGITVTDIPSLADHYTVMYLADKGTVFRVAMVLNTSALDTFTYTGTQLGRELTNQFLDAPPAGISYICHFKGQMYGAEYLPEVGNTVVWFSEELGYHLFNLNSSFFMVPGHVVMLAATDDNLTLSTTNRTFLYTREGLVQVAEYGAIPGQHADIGPDDKLYFWTTRGLCRTAPFENLTLSNVSLEPGVRAAGGVTQRHGYVQYVAVLKSGGAAFNKR